MKRFITEYASYLFKELENNSQMQPRIIVEKAETIERILKATRKGYITTHEAMQNLSQV